MILYLHGFASGPASTKGTWLARRFAERGVEVIRADLTPGEDGFERATPVTMLAEAERAADAAPGARVLMGSSLGGWLSAILAARRPAVERLVLLAPAFRLAERWRARLSPEELARWRAEGALVDHYASGRKRRVPGAFLDDAARLPAFPDPPQRALCIAGARDELVPLEDVARFVALAPERRELVTVDDGHELVGSLERIFAETARFLGV